LIKNKEEFWKIAYWVLLAGWIVGAALHMMKFRGYFLTNYLSDLVFPPWFYISIRKLNPAADNRHFRITNWFARSPERAAASIFLVGAITEISSKFWPKGIFGGTFDPVDILCYFIGLMSCYVIERIQIAKEKELRIKN
jgi:hypothetical protein